MIIVANENGDWWGIDETMLTNLYVLDTAKVTDKDALERIAEWADIRLDYDEEKDEYIIPEDIYKQIDEELPHSDKLERMAWEYGKEITVNVAG